MSRKSSKSSWKRDTSSDQNKEDRGFALGGWWETRGIAAAKHGANALSRTLRIELLGKPIRVTEIAPGLVETEFSVVRFEGDRAKADKVYEGMTPLTAEDVADAVAYVVTRPPHVDIDYVSIRPTDQASARDVHRSG